MTDNEIIGLLDRILDAMSRYKHSSGPADKTYLISTIDATCIILGPRSIQPNTHPEIIKKAKEIWYRCFAKYQGKKLKELHSIDSDVRIKLIEHNFFLNITMLHEQSLLFRLFSTLHISAIEPLIERLHSNNVLEQVLSQRNNNGHDIFEHIESIMARNLSRNGNLSKLLQYKSFACKLSECLIEYGWSHRFSSRTLETMLQKKQKNNKEVNVRSSNKRRANTVPSIADLTASKRETIITRSRSNSLPNKKIKRTNDEISLSNEVDPFAGILTFDPKDHDFENLEPLDNELYTELHNLLQSRNETKSPLIFSRPISPWPELLDTKEILKQFEEFEAKESEFLFLSPSSSPKP